MTGRVDRIGGGLRRTFVLPGTLAPLVHGPDKELGVGVRNSVNLPVAISKRQTA